MTTACRDAAEVPWPDVERVFAPPGDAAGCWCQWFRRSNRDLEEAPADALREALRQQVEARDDGPGLVALRDGEPVGWIGVGPREKFPRLARSPLTRGHREDAPGPAWAVTCFVVRPEHRRQGVARALLDAAVEHAVQRGAAMLEGYPVDTAVRQRASAAELYHGTLALFEGAGFVVAARPSPGRALVRLDVRDADPARARN